MRGYVEPPAESRCEKHSPLGESAQFHGNLHPSRAQAEAAAVPIEEDIGRRETAILAARLRQILWIQQDALMSTWYK